VTPPRIVTFIVRHLDRSAADLPPASSERLKAARSIALERRKVVSAVRLAGHPGEFHLDVFAQRALAHAVLALFLATGFSFWHANRYISQTAEMDTAILADDLPIDVLTDKGFDQWLQSSGEH
jgi:hypothetical protein